MTTQSPAARVLVLDDDPATLRLQTMTLEEAGYVVCAYSGSSDALQALKSSEFDLLVIDHRLHEPASGVDVYRRVRASGIDVPAILVTGFSDERRVIEALRAGIRDVVPKTDDYLDYLPTVVARVLAHVRAEHDAALLAASQESEERLRALNAELERQAEQLRHQAEDLEYANRTKDEFLATLAHELRNPLAPIRFALALMRDVSPEHVHARDVIDRQLSQLVRLVDDLLDVSRITRNLIQLRREAVPFPTIVRASIESVAPLVQSGGLQMTVREPLPAVTLDADPARLSQVFTNLLHNAVKFTPRGGAIALSGELSDGQLVARISDTGAGIPKKDLDRIFDVFYQVERPHARAGGLGIGLTLVKRLVELHGGKVVAESAGVGHGTTFTLTLPVMDVAAPASHRPAARRGGAVRRLRVLVVDDNVDAAELLALVVEEFGHEPVTAHRGDEACALVDSFHPDVALLDIGLPDMSGYDVARTIRSRAPNGVFLAAITGWGQDEDRRRARDAGFDCHFVKPADPELLERLLIRVANGQPCDACDRCLHLAGTAAAPA